MRNRTWTESQLREAASQVSSIRQLLMKLGLREAGGNYKQIKYYLQLYKISTTHFRGRAWNKGLIGRGQHGVSLEKILVKGSYFQSYKLKKRLFQAGLKLPVCELCGWSEKAKDGRIPVELDHINGQPIDNRLENLRVLCPNCHSLQATHRGRNIKKKSARW